MDGWTDGRTEEGREEEIDEWITNNKRHWRRERETSYLFQQMSVALQRGNAVKF